MTAAKHWRWTRGCFPRRDPPQPLALVTLTLPAHPWVIEVGGRVFKTLAAAETYARASFGVPPQPIYCRIARKETTND